jgi:UDP-N-acetylmuramyl pentapeptide synthase
MKELGTYAEESHGSIVDLLVELRLDHLLVGPCFTIAVEARSAQTGGASLDKGFAFADITGLQQHIMDHPIEGKQILLKGSRSMALEQLIELL